MLRAGGLCLDRVSNTVTGVRFETKPVSLTKRESNLLSVLMSAPHRVFTRKQLLTSAFDGADTPGTVDTYVHYLRQKLGSDVVRTVRGSGYRLGKR